VDKRQIPPADAQPFQFFVSSGAKQG